MANSNERAELHKTIWKIANDLRGNVDGWEFKAYVLGSIFYRFISENICDYFNQRMHDLGHLLHNVNFDNFDILSNDANLSVSSYVEQEDTREVININEVNARLETLIAEGNELNEKIEEIIK